MAGSAGQAPAGAWGGEGGGERRGQAGQGSADRGDQATSCLLLLAHLAWQQQGSEAVGVAAGGSALQGHWSHRRGSTGAVAQAGARGRRAQRQQGGKLRRGEAAVGMVRGLRPGGSCLRG